MRTGNDPIDQREKIDDRRNSHHDFPVLMNTRQPQHKISEEREEAKLDGKDRSPAQDQIDPIESSEEVNFNQQSVQVSDARSTAAEEAYGVKAGSLDQVDGRSCVEEEDCGGGQRGTPKEKKPIIQAQSFRYTQAFVYVQANNNTGKSNGDGDTIRKPGYDLPIYMSEVSKRATRLRCIIVFAHSQSLNS